MKACVYMHTHTYMYMHTYKHTYALVHIHAYMQMYTYIPSYVHNIEQHNDTCYEVYSPVRNDLLTPSEFKITQSPES